MELIVTAQLQEEIEFHKRLMEDLKVYFNIDMYNINIDNILSTYVSIYYRKK